MSKAEMSTLDFLESTKTKKPATNPASQKHKLAIKIKPVAADDIAKMTEPHLRQVRWWNEAAKLPPITKDERYRLLAGLGDRPKASSVPVKSSNGVAPPDVVAWIPVTEYPQLYVGKRERNVYKLTCYSHVQVVRREVGLTNRFKNTESHHICDVAQVELTRKSKGTLVFWPEERNAVEKQLDVAVKETSKVLIRDRNNDNEEPIPGWVKSWPKAGRICTAPACNTVIKRPFEANFVQGHDDEPYCIRCVAKAVDTKKARVVAELVPA